MQGGNMSKSLKQSQALDTSLIIRGNNDRTVFKDKEVMDLAKNISINSLIHPITVRPVEGTEFYQIVEGEMRFRACHLLKWKHIPARVRNLTDEEASAIMLAENVSRTDLDPIDEAEAYAKRMKAFNWTVEDCARFAGVTTIRVQFRLKLLALIPDIRHLIRSGNFPLGYAQIAAQADLDNFFQVLALTKYRDNSHPTIPWFRNLCDMLHDKQAQGVMFDSPLFDGQCDIGSGSVDSPSLPSDPRIDNAPLIGKSPRDKITSQLNFWQQAAEDWKGLGRPFKHQECQAVINVLQFTLDAGWIK